MRVQRVTQAVAAPFARQVEVPDLTPRVHAGVGSSGRVHDAPLAGGALERGFDRLLYR